MPNTDFQGFGKIACKTCVYCLKVLGSSAQPVAVPFSHVSHNNHVAVSSVEAVRHLLVEFWQVKAEE
jgi:hypothetical protein